MRVRDEPDYIGTGEMGKGFPAAFTWTCITGHGQPATLLESELADDFDNIFIPNDDLDTVIGVLTAHRDRLQATGAIS